MAKDPSPKADKIDHGSKKQQEAFGQTISLLIEFLGPGEEAWQKANWLARELSSSGLKLVRYEK